MLRGQLNRARIGVRPFLCPSLMIAASAASACTFGHADNMTPTPTGATSVVRQTTVDPCVAKTVINAFDANEFFSISEAEAVAGFHIATPSEYYPLGFGRTYLQRAQDGSGVLSTTQYTYPPLPSHSIGVDAGPAAVFNIGSFESKEPRTIGAKSGWLLRNDGKAIQFAYRYGEAGGVALWAVVQAPAAVGLDAFQQFVQSLH